HMAAGRDAEDSLLIAPPRRPRGRPRQAAAHRAAAAAPARGLRGPVHLRGFPLRAWGSALRCDDRGQGEGSGGAEIEAGSGGGWGGVSACHPALLPGSPPHVRPSSRVAELRVNCGWGRSFRGGVHVLVNVPAPVPGSVPFGNGNGSGNVDGHGNGPGPGITPP